MGLLCNTLGSPPCGFYGIGWGVTIGTSMAWFYGQCLGIPWTCIGPGHWEFHGSALWVYHCDVYRRLLWTCMANAP